MNQGTMDPNEFHLGMGNIDLNENGNPSDDYYISPRLSSKDKNFCTGLARAESCEERPINPRYESMKAYEIPIPEKNRDRKYTDKQTQKRFWFFN